jgi:hypothetical protein
MDLVSHEVNVHGSHSQRLPVGLRWCGREKWRQMGWCERAFPDEKRAKQDQTRENFQSHQFDGCGGVCLLHIPPLPLSLSLSLSL